MNWSVDASDVVSGEATLFPDYPPTQDEIFHSLVKPSDLDSTAQEILQVLFTSLLVLEKHLPVDHLCGRVLDNPSQRLVTETKSVPTSNTISERDFANLDCLLREKPNATTVALKGLSCSLTTKQLSGCMKNHLKTEKLFSREHARSHLSSEICTNRGGRKS